MDTSGQHFSVWKCALGAAASAAGEQPTLEEGLQRLCTKGAKWVVLLASGGHFAGAVIQGGNTAAPSPVNNKGKPSQQQGGKAPALRVVAHSTFHRYARASLRSSSLRFWASQTCT